MGIFITIALVLSTYNSTNLNVKNESDVCLSQDEIKLFEIINIYRETLDLQPIPFSKALTRVSQAHVRDLSDHYTFKRGAKCNPHSWSRKGKWSSCCYTNDHKQAKCMWNKPREISGFDSNGYEILSYSSDGITPGEALIGWQKSQPHHQVMINSAKWTKVTWKSMGVGIYNEYAVIWFAELEDSDGQTISVCN